MLRAVGVPRRDPEQDDLFGPRLVTLRHQGLQQRRIVIDHARLAPDFHAAAMGIIQQEDVGLGVLGEIALADELPVAAVIGECQRALVENPDEAFRAAAMLDIGLAVRGSGCQEHAVLFREERREVGIDLGAPPAILLDARVGIARTLASLNRLHRRGERHVTRIMLHVRHRRILGNFVRRSARACLRPSTSALSRFQQSSGLTLYHCRI